MSDNEKRCHDLSVAFVAYKASKDTDHVWNESEFLDAYATAYQRFADEFMSVMNDSDLSEV